MYRHINEIFKFNGIVYKCKSFDYYEEDHCGCCYCNLYQFCKNDDHNKKEVFVGRCSIFSIFNR